MLDFLGVIGVIGGTIIIGKILASIFPKSRKFWYGVMIVVVVVVFFQSCGPAMNSLKDDLNGKEESVQAKQKSEIEELTAELESLSSENEELTSKIKELQAQLDTINSVDEASSLKILNIVFAPNGKTYEPKEGFQFYSDVTCQTEIDGIKFLTDVSLHEELDNGSTIYILRSDKGYVFCIRQPELTEIKVTDN